MFSSGHNPNISLLPDNPSAQIMPVQGGGGRDSLSWISAPVVISDNSLSELSVNPGLLKKFKTRWRQTLGPNVPSRRKPRNDPHIVIGILNTSECDTYLVAPFRDNTKVAKAILAWANDLLKNERDVHVIFTGSNTSKYIESGILSLLVAFPGHAIYVCSDESTIPSLDGLLLHAVPNTSQQVAIGFIPNHENVYQRSTRNLDCLTVDTLRIPYSKHSDYEKGDHIYTMSFHIPKTIEPREKDYDETSINSDHTFYSSPGWVTQIFFGAKVDMKGGAEPTKTEVKPLEVKAEVKPAEIKPSNAESTSGAETINVTFPRGEYKIRNPTGNASIIEKWKKGEFSESERKLLEDQGLQFPNEVYSIFLKKLIDNECSNETSTQLSPDCGIFRAIAANIEFKRIQAKNGRTLVTVGNPSLPPLPASPASSPVVTTATTSSLVVPAPATSEPVPTAPATSEPTPTAPSEPTPTATSEPAPTAPTATSEPAPTAPTATSEPAPTAPTATSEPVPSESSIPQITSVEFNKLTQDGGFNPAAMSEIETKLKKADFGPKGSSIDITKYNTIYITSDIHADVRKFLNLLLKEEIISIPNFDPYTDDVYNTEFIEKIEFLKPKTLFLALGDLIDGKRQSAVDDKVGNFELLLHTILFNMRLSAKAKGSDVLFTMGNHDFANILSENGNEKSLLNYSHSVKYFNSGSTNNLFVALNPFYELSPYIMLFLKNGTKDEFACIHAGFHRKIDNNIKNYTQVLKQLQDGIEKSGLKHISQPTDEIKQQMLSLEKGADDGGLWTRDYSSGAIECKELNTDPTIVVGHCTTPAKNFKRLQSVLLGKSVTSPPIDYKDCDGGEGSARKGCVIADCFDEADKRPKLIFVDTMMSSCFYDENNKDRNSEFLLLEHKGESGDKWINSISRKPAGEAEIKLWPLAELKPAEAKPEVKPKVTKAKTVKSSGPKAKQIEPINAKGGSRSKTYKKRYSK